MRSVFSRSVAVVCLAAALGAGAVGCGSSTPVARPAVTPASAAPPAAAASATPLPRSEPVRVAIPAAGVDTGPLLKLGLNADGTVQVPPVPQADRIGWYTRSVTPGETGPSVLIGHYDTVDGPAVLRDIAKVRVGDRITVTRADGTKAVFAVRAIQEVAKDDFPTRRVYGDTARPELRLITCGGDIVGGHRPDNVIVYADLVR
ncbi:class F sortase [Streptantibioticus cattleyicolor]|uniref:Lipoprotein n=1 Tax=Streptantibioticus cattleyicolor (strain ATCC 35852 / DSM 46488 / JCM 4925 / NBRC 14057 / NRRL 8057) TaxID=1003195 RepID=F8JJC9_STREN|nr:class F sortase [Streptantibioticus cattleyicolor]AEW98755.1 lipoprotein [Streptantibioticus cattleyicolor NRRL 8057 = DSM 46488]CCB72193.1 putative lipoprotein [Streptantibioticus cattleyicolor NRRL 8057 = DSM 46488]